MIIGDEKWPTKVEPYIPRLIELGWNDKHVFQVDLWKMSESQWEIQFRLIRS